MTTPTPTWQQLLDYGFPPLPPKRKVFISYQHEDEWWYDRFHEHFCDRLELFTNRALQEPIDSDDLRDVVHRAIRERHITGTSVTIVLCGAETWKRMCVDWEIGSSVNKDHGLLGIALPSALRNSMGQVIVPDRLYHNWLTGYAGWLHWTADPGALQTAIEYAIWRASFYQADNRWPFMTENRR